MQRRFITILMIVALCWTTVGCNSSSTSTQSSSTESSSTPKDQVKRGTYPVQQTTYDDANGIYTLILLNTNDKEVAQYRTANLKMARLTDEQIANGDQTLVEITGNEATLFLTKDFKIEYTHAITETQTNPKTGQTETIVVSRETNFWTPFAGAFMGQAVGNLLFSPRYYVPPMYQPGDMLRGYGGSGTTYNQAVDNYRSKYNAPPTVVKNRETLRTSGNLRRYPSTSKSPLDSSKSSGSGVGSSKLNTSGISKPTTQGTQRKSSFGSFSHRRRARRRRRLQRISELMLLPFTLKL